MRNEKNPLLAGRTDLPPVYPGKSPCPIPEGSMISVKTDTVESCRGKYIGEDELFGVLVIVVEPKEHVCSKIYIPVSKITAIGVYKNEQQDE